MMVTRTAINQVRTIILIGTPVVLLTLLLLPSLFTSDVSKGVELSHRLAWVYVLLLLGIYWMFNILSISVVSFVPLMIFPLLGSIHARTLAEACFSSYNVTVFGSIVIMIATDNCGLTKRLTLTILKHSSGSIRWIFIDIYLATMWTAMWVNSCAAVFLMMKVIDQVLDNLKEEFVSGAMGEERSAMKPIILETARSSQLQEENTTEVTVEVEATIENNSEPVANVEETRYETGKNEQESNATALAQETFLCENENLLNEFGGDLLYATAVAANIGSIFCSFGNPMGFQIMKPEYYNNTLQLKHGLTEASWIIYSLPLLIMNGSIALSYLLWIHFSKQYGKRVKAFLVSKNQRITDFTQGHETLNTVGKIFSDKYARLPVWDIKEKIVMFLLGLAILLCLTKHPVFMKGWDALIHRAMCKSTDKAKCTRSGAGDSAPYITVVFVLFLIPSWGLQIFKGPPAAGIKPTATNNILGWKKLQSTYPYLVFILIVASESIGRVSEFTVAEPLSTYLRETFGKSMTSLKLAMMTFTASVSVFLPNPGTSIVVTRLWYKIMFTKNKVKEINEILLLLPILSVACLRFVIPASSIPTAMVYGYKEKKTLSAWYLLRVGLPLFFCTFIPTIIYALLWTPKSLGSY